MLVKLDLFVFFWHDHREMNEQATCCGELIRSARERLGWTQAQLASKIGVTASYITKIEGSEATASYDRVIDLARALALDPNTLLMGMTALRRSRAEERSQSRGTAVAVLGTIPEEPRPLEGTGSVAEQIGREILADPELRQAFSYLRTALANPHFKPAVLKTLEAFAKGGQP
jgi:transcriptional regulator with XRE-family HTH domain